MQPLLLTFIMKQALKELKVFKVFKGFKEF